MCHFDDDNYVNVPQLMRLLGNFDPRRDWYLGRPSTRGPIDIFDRLDEPAKKVANLVVLSCTLMHYARSSHRQGVLLIQRLTMTRVIVAGGWGGDTRGCGGTLRALIIS